MHRLVPLTVVARQRTKQASAWSSYVFIDPTLYVFLLTRTTFHSIQEQTAERKIDWVPKARWVVDGAFWSASGVTAGIDMTVAWLKQVIGEEQTREIQALVEVSSKEEGDDEWAAYHGLVPQ